VKKGEKSAGGQVVELLVIVATALGLALAIQAFLVKPYRIPSESMVPTLAVGERVLVNRIGERFSDPGVGDIVVFHPPHGADDAGGGECADPTEGRGHSQVCGKATSTRSQDNFIKRVVGGPGDTIRVVDGHVIRNGKRAKEPWAQKCGGGEDCNFPQSFKVPPGHWFMMGDNRGFSEDSRFWGPVPRKWIIGGAFASYWPPKRIGLL
jgi:signal peptidase I